LGGGRVGLLVWGGGGGGGFALCPSSNFITKDDVLQAVSASVFR
jgi:hypothetical protein